MAYVNKSIFVTTTAKELLEAVCAIHANIVTATFSKETISKISGCAYIKSGGRTGRRNEVVEDLQMSLLNQAQRLRHRRNQMNIKQVDWRHDGKCDTDWTR